MSGDSNRHNKGTATLVLKLNQTQEVLIVSYTVQSKEVRLPYIQRGCKKLHSLRSLYTGSYTYCCADWIWFCGTRGLLRSFVFPKGHPQQHNQMQLLAQSLELGYYRRITKGYKDYVIQLLKAMILGHGNRGFSRSSMPPNVHPGRASNSDRSWRTSNLTSSGNKPNTNSDDDNSRQPWVPGAQPGTKTAQ
jgi:hypothetical protein